MFIIVTKVEVKDGYIDNVLELFKQKNPDLVKDEKDWIKAIFLADRTEGNITVLAFWKNDNSYIQFSQSDNFKKTMMEFSQFFQSRPHVSINEILFEM